MKVGLADLLARIPGAPSAQWPQGERYALAFEHGSMSVGFYAPIDADLQQPHKRDELYLVHAGSGEVVIADKRHLCKPGDVFFVDAGVNIASKISAKAFVRG
jgi:mannose-6-phosphate isomerase-like protein (cupin superfamily)